MPSCYVAWISAPHAFEPRGGERLVARKPTHPAHGDHTPGWDPKGFVFPSFSLGNCQNEAKPVLVAVYTDRDKHRFRLIAKTLLYTTRTLFSRNTKNNQFSIEISKVFELAPPHPPTSPHGQAWRGSENVTIYKRNALPKKREGETPIPTSPKNNQFFKEISKALHPPPSVRGSPGLVFFWGGELVSHQRTSVFHLNSFRAQKAKILGLGGSRGA